MYEGVTEYFAGHVQVYGGMKTPKEYLALIEEKLMGAAHFKDELAFTELSLQCLDEHEDQYSNVYLKGAIIGMCLDILLRDQSGGKIGIKDMMAMLSKEYGKYKSFEDVELFDKIAELSSPEIREFFTKYVEAGNELPLADLLNRVGVTFKKDVKVKEIGLYIADMSNINEFGKALGYKINDEFVAINGVEINMDSVQEQMNNFKKNTKNGDKVEIIVARTQKGKTKNKKLKAKAITIEKNKKYLIELNENATKEQLELRNAWLGQE